MASAMTKLTESLMVREFMAYWTGGFDKIIRDRSRAPSEPTFYWYVGHDPYNSADDRGFMERLKRRTQ